MTTVLIKFGLEAIVSKNIRPLWIDIRSSSSNGQKTLITLIVLKYKPLKERKEIDIEYMEREGSRVKAASWSEFMSSCSREMCSNKYPTNIQQIFNKYPTNIWQISNKYPKNIQQISASWSEFMGSCSREMCSNNYSHSLYQRYLFIFTFQIFIFISYNFSNTGIHFSNIYFLFLNIYFHFSNIPFSLLVKDQRLLVKYPIVVDGSEGGEVEKCVPTNIELGLMWG